MFQWVTIKATHVRLVMSSLPLAAPKDEEAVNITGLKARSWGDVKSRPGRITWPKKFFGRSKTVNVVYAMLKQR